MVPFQDIKLLNMKDFYDLKVAFKLDYPKFKDGSIALVFTGDEDEEIEIFNIEIKRAGLIYTKNHWAIYDQRMFEVSKSFRTMSLKIANTSMENIDLRIGMISFTPTLMLDPDIFKI